MEVCKVHTCKFQEEVAKGIKEPPRKLKKCSCRKVITLKQATDKVKQGEAMWIVTRRKNEFRDVNCSLCKGDKEVRNCANCFGTGVVRKEVEVDKQEGTDIVYVSNTSMDTKKYKYNSAKMTPRVATIEPSHIKKAYVLELKEASERIEEYGRLVLDARAFVGKNRIPAIKEEPKDDITKWQGRRFDYGRAI